MKTKALPISKVTETRKQMHCSSCEWHGQWTRQDVVLACKRKSDLGFSASWNKQKTSSVNPQISRVPILCVPTNRRGNRTCSHLVIAVINFCQSRFLSQHESLFVSACTITSHYEPFVVSRAPLIVVIRPAHGDEAKLNNESSSNRKSQTDIL